MDAAVKEFRDGIFALRTPIRHSCGLMIGALFRFHRSEPIP